MATYLITQATGHQSQSIIKLLLAAGANVHAVVRDPSKISPILKSPGVTVFKGDSDDLDAVFAAAQGCSAAFLNTFPIPGLEARQAQTIVAACKKAGVENLVASTTYCTGRKDLWDTEACVESQLIDYYRSKAEVEDVVRTAGFESYVIVRPCFMDYDYMLPHVHWDFPELPTQGVLVHGYDDGVGMPHTAVDDVSRFVVRAFQDPARFNGAEVDFAFETLTVEQVRDILVRVSGGTRDVKVRRGDAREMEETFFRFRFHRFASLTDLSEVEKAAMEAKAKYGIEVTSIEDALQGQKDRLLECLPA